MKEFTLQDLADAIIGEEKIRHKNWPKREFIKINDDGLTWVDQDSDELRPNFNPISDWDRYQEPPKTEKRTFYRPVIYVHDKDNVDQGYPWMNLDQKENLSFHRGYTILSWEEREFEIPVKEGE